jgi:hypothetical protein
VPTSLSHQFVTLTRLVFWSILGRLARRTIVYRLAEDVEIGLWPVRVRIISFVEECIECFEDKRFPSTPSLMLLPLAG